jgi:WD40 repeat protein
MPHTGQLVRYPSRRGVLRGLVGLLLGVSLEGCGQPFFTSAPPTPPTLTPASSAPKRVLYTYRGHTDRVTSVAWSSSSKYIASGSLDRTVQVWGASPADHVRPFIYRGHSDGVQTVDWSPHSDRVVSGSIDKTVQVWDASNGEHAAIFRGHRDVVQTVGWSPDGTSIASGSADGTVRVWEAATGKLAYVYKGHQGSVNTLAWSSDSRRIASASADKTVQIFDAASGRHVFTYRGHSDTVSSVSWAPDGEYIVSGSFDKTAQVWHAATGALLYRWSGYNVKAALTNTSKGVLPDIIFAVAWSHKGKRVAAVTQVYCGDLCGVVMGWDALTERNLTFYVDVPVFAIAWSPDDTRLVSSISVSTQGLPQENKHVDGSFVEITGA